MQLYNHALFTAGTDFKNTTKVVALAPGQREERVRVLIIDDSTAEETETFTAILTTGDVELDVATVTILDDDSKYNGEGIYYAFVVSILID